MATTTASLEAMRPTPRARGSGIVLLILATLIFVLFAWPLDAGLTARFGLNLSIGGVTPQVQLPDLVLPARLTITLFAVLAALLGGWQLLRGFRQASLALGVVILLFVLAFLTWATAGKSLNLTGMLQSSLLRAIPIVLGALSGILCERSGVINIAIEGMMLSGAFIGAFIGSAAHNSWVGMLAAILLGALLAAVHAVLSIKYKVDQIISGTVINIFAAGATSFLSSRILQEHQELNNPAIFPPIPIPGLAQVPLIGPVFFANTIIVYMTLALIVIIHVMLFYTRWGLRTRAVGEHPRAADTLGINVFRVRYINVILGGMVAGLGGAYFTLGSVGPFDELMTAGRGFIGLAAMIFGKWTPFGAFGSSLIFGFADSLQTKLQILGTPIPSEFLLMAPYLATILAVAGLVGRAVPPAADGQPYEREGEVRPRPRRKAATADPDPQQPEQNS
jgi:ABC-type uncharacterized transport system permease subunit